MTFVCCETLTSNLNKTGRNHGGQQCGFISWRQMKKDGNSGSCNVSKIIIPRVGMRAICCNIFSRNIGLKSMTLYTQVPPNKACPSPRVSNNIGAAPAGLTHLFLWRADLNENGYLTVTAASSIKIDQESTRENDKASNRYTELITALVWIKPYQFPFPRKNTKRLCPSKKQLQWLGNLSRTVDRFYKINTSSCCKLAHPAPFWDVFEISAMK